MEKLSPDQRVSALEAKLLYSFPDRAVALSALTHKSYTNEHPEEGASDNERLEFLGDAVIDLAISDRLMARFPLAAEGELTELRALIVSEQGLARVARKLGLGEVLLLGRGEELSGGGDRSSVLADGLEAVLAAVYLSSGLVKVLELVDRHFADALAGVAELRLGADFKSRLQRSVYGRLSRALRVVTEAGAGPEGPVEVEALLAGQVHARVAGRTSKEAEAAASQKLSPKYRVVSEHGAEHEKIFEIEVVVGDVPYARATGRSKKEAEQAAARETLRMLDELVARKPG